MSRQRTVLTARFHGILFLVGIGTFLVHEFSHWLAGVALGYDMVATPNHVGSTGPMGAGHQALVSIAGPVVTIAQGLLGFWLVRHRRSLPGFALLYMAFFMRAVATGVSLFHPNDEARVSLYLGLGPWTLPLLVVAGLLVLVVSASRHLKLRLLDQFLCYLVASVVVSLIVGLDMMLWRGA